jgi:hypothetical protein
VDHGEELGKQDKPEQMSTVRRRAEHQDWDHQDSIRRRGTVEADETRKVGDRGHTQAIREMIGIQILVFSIHSPRSFGGEERLRDMVQVIGGDFELRVIPQSSAKVTNILPKLQKPWAFILKFFQRASLNLGKHRHVPSTGSGSGSFCRSYSKSSSRRHW